MGQADALGGRGDGGADDGAHGLAPIPCPADGPCGSGEFHPKDLSSEQHPPMAIISFKSGCF